MTNLAIGMDQKIEGAEAEAVVALIHIEPLLRLRVRGQQDSLDVWGPGYHFQRGYHHRPQHPSPLQASGPHHQRLAQQKWPDLVEVRRRDNSLARSPEATTRHEESKPQGALPQAEGSSSPHQHLPVLAAPDIQAPWHPLQNLQPPLHHQVLTERRDKARAI